MSDSVQGPLLSTRRYKLSFPPKRGEGIFCRVKNCQIFGGTSTINLLRSIKLQKSKERNYRVSHSLTNPEFL
jgi:hypothetical protein